MIAFPKPPRGEHVVDRDLQRAQIRAAEKAAKDAAKARDHWTCRFPGRHDCRGILEGAHIFEDKKMGGDHGLVSDTWNLMALCSWAHRRGTPSVHGKLLKVEPETAAMADGPCSFWARASVLDEWVCVGVESAIGVLMKV